MLERLSDAACRVMIALRMIKFTMMSMMMKMDITEIPGTARIILHDTKDQ